MAAWADVAETLKGVGPVGALGLIGLSIGTSYDEWMPQYQHAVEYVGLFMIGLAALWGFGAFVGRLTNWAPLMRLGGGFSSSEALPPPTA